MKQHVHKALMAWAIAFFWLSGMGIAQAQPPTPPATQDGPRAQSVRFVYLVSVDRKFNPAYKAGIEMAARDIQAWYKRQLGTTFRLNDPIVEVAYSKQKATWFYGNPNGDDPKLWGYNNTYDEAHRLVGVQRDDPDYIWVVYSDGPGNDGRGGSGVCIMPEDDLLGLIGKHPQQKEINRWIAGLGHEAGHAFGLSHPDDTEADADAIMWMGIYDGKYPDQCYLTPDDKRRLNASPFFFDDAGNSNAGTTTLLATFEYEDGYFSRYKNSKSGAITWVETKKDKSATFNFEESQADKEQYYLKSVDRDLMISIPIHGGESEISTDLGTNWHFFQPMKLVE